MERFAERQFSLEKQIFEWNSLPGNEKQQEVVKNGPSEKSILRGEKMENIKITALEEELRNYHIVSNGGIVNGVKIGMMGISQHWIRDEIFRCRKLQERSTKKEIVRSK